MGIHKYNSAKKKKLKKLFKIFDKTMEYNNEIVYTEVPVGEERYQYYVPRVQTGSVAKRRPGKEPSLPDSALSTEELDRRNNRRRRNREAAARVRERRMGKMAHLECQVEDLKRDQKLLQDKNDELREELRKLKAQSAPSAAQPVHRLTRQISNTDAPTEMPMVPKLENMTEVFHGQTAVSNNQSNILFTPGGTFVLTPVRQDIRFDFPEPAVRHRSASDGEYKKIIQNL